MTRKRRNPDEEMRELERRAGLGDADAAAKLRRMQGRVSGRGTKAPKPVKATHTNVFALWEHMQGRQEGSVRADSTSAPHIKRTIQAGLAALDPARGVLVLTPEGQRVMAEYHAEQLRRIPPENLARYYPWAVRANPDRLEYAEVHEETRGGSGVSGGTANRFLQVIASAFAGGQAFTAKSLAAEARSSESAARQGIALLRRRGYVHEFGRELNRLGRPGPMRFVGTVNAEERAQSQRDMDAEREGERLAEQEIAAREALAEFLAVPRARPGEGKTYRPVIRRKPTQGHSLPRLTAKRIKGAGYRVCAGGRR